MGQILMMEAGGFLGIAVFVGLVLVCKGLAMLRYRRRAARRKTFGDVEVDYADHYYISNDGDLYSSRHGKLTRKD